MLQVRFRMQQDVESVHTQTKNLNVVNDCFPTELAASCCTIVSQQQHTTRQPRLQMDVTQLQRFGKRYGESTVLGVGLAQQLLT